MEKETCGFRTEESFGGKNRTVIKTPNPDVNDSRKLQENGILAGGVVESRETRGGFLDSDLKEEPLNRRGRRRGIGGERNRGGQSFRWTLKTRSTEC